MASLLVISEQIHDILSQTTKTEAHQLYSLATKSLYMAWLGK